MPKPTPQHPNRNHPSHPFNTPDEVAAIRAWMEHLDAGRIGNKPPVNERARAIALHNERVICGDPVDRVW